MCAALVVLGGTAQWEPCQACGLLYHTNSEPMRRHRGRGERIIGDCDTKTDPMLFLPRRNTEPNPGLGLTIGLLANPKPNPMTFLVLKGSQVGVGLYPGLISPNSIPYTAWGPHRCCVGSPHPTHIGEG